MARVKVEYDDDEWGTTVVNEDDGTVDVYTGKDGEDEHNHVVYDAEGECIYMRIDGEVLKQ